MCLCAFVVGAFLLVFGAKEAVGAADGEQFVGGFVDLGHRNFGYRGAVNEPMLVSNRRETVRIGRSRMTTTGVPTAAAMCTGPVSFEINSVRRACADTSCGIVSRSKKIVPAGNSCPHLRHHLPLFRTGENDDSHPVVSHQVIRKLGKVFQRPDAGCVLPAPGKSPTSSSPDWAFSFFSSASTAKSSAALVFNTGVRAGF